MSQDMMLIVQRWSILALKTDARTWLVSTDGDSAKLDRRRSEISDFPIQEFGAKKFRKQRVGTRNTIQSQHNAAITVETTKDVAARAGRHWSAEVKKAKAAG